jgi:hypothetical protein
VRAGDNAAYAPMPCAVFRVDDALDWLDRAEQAREVAGQLTDPGAKQAVLHLAESFERLARTAADRTGLTYPHWEQLQITPAGARASPIRERGRRRRFVSSCGSGEVWEPRPKRKFIDLLYMKEQPLRLRAALLALMLDHGCTGQKATL